MQLTHAEATRAVMAPHVPALLSALGRGLKISSAADTQGDKGDVDLLGAELRGEARDHSVISTLVRPAGQAINRAINRVASLAPAMTSLGARHDLPWRPP